MHKETDSLFLLGVGDLGFTNKTQKQMDRTNIYQNLCSNGKSQ